jgi:3-dehydroquinate dehydratase
MGIAHVDAAGRKIGEKPIDTVTGVRGSPDARLNTGSLRTQSNVSLLTKGTKWLLAGVLALSAVTVLSKLRDKSDADRQHHQSVMQKEFEHQLALDYVQHCRSQNEQDIVNPNIFPHRAHDKHVLDAIIAKNYEFARLCCDDIEDQNDEYFKSARRAARLRTILSLSQGEDQQDPEKAKVFFVSATNEAHLFLQRDPESWEAPIMIAYAAHMAGSPDAPDLYRKALPSFEAMTNNFACGNKEAITPNTPDGAKWNMMDVRYKQAMFIRWRAVLDGAYHVDGVAHGVANTGVE